MNKKYEKYVLATLALAMSVFQPGDARFDLKEIKSKSLIAHGGQPGSCAGHTKSIADGQAQYESQQKKKKKKKKQAAQTADSENATSYRVDEDADSDESEEE